MKKKTARKKVQVATKSVKHASASKKHQCFLSYCVCKHPSVFVSLILLILVSFSAIYFMLSR